MRNLKWRGRTVLSPRPSSVLSLRLGVLALATFGAAAVVPACNAVLDNRTGVLVADGGAAFGNEPAPEEGAPEETADPDGTGSSSSSSSSGGGSSSGSSGEGPRDAGSPDADADAGEGDADAGAAPLVCPVGFADCDLLPTNGCEADLALPTTCGACNVVCPVVPQAVSTCVAGACRLTCVVGRADCNAEAADGCEADLAKDKRNCGACGVRCLIGKCKEGVCTL